MKQLPTRTQRTDGAQRQRLQGRPQISLGLRRRQRYSLLQMAVTLGFMWHARSVLNHPYPSYNGNDDHLFALPVYFTILPCQTQAHVLNSIVLYQRTYLGHQFLLWGLSCLLPQQQLLPRCLSTRVCLHRRPFNFSSLADIANRYLHNSSLWNQDYIAYRSSTRGPRLDRCILYTSNMAAVPKSRSLLRHWNGFLICRLCGHNSSVVHHKEKSSQWHWHGW